MHSNNKYLFFLKKIIVLDITKKDVNKGNNVSIFIGSTPIIAIKLINSKKIEIIFMNAILPGITIIRKAIIVAIFKFLNGFILINLCYLLVHFVEKCLKFHL